MKWLIRIIGGKIFLGCLPTIFIIIVAALIYLILLSSFGWLGSDEDGKSPSVMLQDYVGKISDEIASVHALYDSYVDNPKSRGYDLGFHEAGSERRISDDIDIDLLAIIVVQKIKLLQAGEEDDPSGGYDLKTFDSISNKELKKTLELFYSFSTRSDIITGPPCVTTEYGTFCSQYKAVYANLKNYSTPDVIKKLRFNAEDLEIFYAVQQALVEVLIGELPSHVDSTPNSKGFAWPVQGLTTITSPFGWRTHPITNERQFHSGIDISGANAEGIPVTPIYPGTVIEVGSGGTEGNYVKVRSEIEGKTIDHVYMHLLSRNIEKDQLVDYGLVIGAVGSTGRSTGPHLHLSIYLNGSLVNPLDYVG